MSKKETIHCRLCEELCTPVNSHILPQFFFKHLKEPSELNQFFSLSINPTTNSIKKKITQKEREAIDPKILCANCDNKVLGSLERYAAGVLFKGRDEVNNNTVGNPYNGLIAHKISGMDYPQFKLFLLSILWRASITDIPMFSAVSLGRKYERQIQEMLLNSDPGDWSDFPCEILSSLTHKHLARDLIACPLRLKSKGHTRYIFYLLGVVLWFYVSKDDRPDNLENLIITEDGKMTIRELDEKNAETIRNAFMPVHNWKRKFALPPRAI